MSTITFDTLKFVKTLKQAGFNENQAEALAQAQTEAIESSADLRYATKQDVRDIKEQLIRHEEKFTLLQWMIGATFAAVMACLWLLLRMTTGAGS